MNFEHMPELGWRFGYPMALGMMLAVSLGLYCSSDGAAGSEHACERYSYHAMTARMRYSATSAQPSNAAASPSPVICQTERAISTSAPIATGPIDERQPVLEEEREQDERREQEDGDLRDRVLDHRDREVVWPFAASVMPTTFSTALPAIATITGPGEGRRDAERSIAGPSASTNQSETNAAPTPASRQERTATRKGSGRARLLERGLASERAVRR